jgi:hypothetical protein
MKIFGLGNGNDDAAKVAKARTEAQRQNDLKKLALSAEGHTVTRVQRDRANAQLVKEVGERQAKRLRKMVADGIADQYRTK